MALRKQAWWSRAPEDIPSAVQQTVQSLANALSEQREDTLHHLRLYSNFNVSGVSDLGAGYYQIGAGRLRFNLCASIADTAASRVFGTRPTVEYLTQGADWATRRKAEKRSQALQGQMYDLGGYVLAQKCGRDALSTGTGIVFGFLDYAGKPALRRVMPNQLLVDPTETLDGQATCIYLAYPCDRQSAIDKWPEQAESLLSAGKDSKSTEHLPQTLGYDAQVDQVTIYEAFRIRCADKPGKHIVCTDNVLLLEEDFDSDEFDIAVLRWVERPFGWFGQGIVERTKDAQWRINKLIQRTEKIQDLASNAMCLIQEGTGLEPDDIHNSPVPVYKYQGAKPEFQKFEATPLDLTNEIGIIREQTLAQEGLNEQSTQGTVPAGVESGAAIRSLDGIQDVRLGGYQRGWEEFHLEMFRLIERLNDRAAAKDSKFTVLGRGTKRSRMTTKSYRWLDLKLPSDDVRMRAAPMSSLPTTVAGRMETVGELSDRGYVSRDRAMEMLQMPDVDAALNDALAHRDLAETQIDWILDGEENVFPIAYQDLEIAAEVANLALVQLEAQRAPDEIKAAVEEYFLATKAQLEEQAAAEAAAAAPPAAAPVDPALAPQAAPSDVALGDALGAPGVQAPVELAA